MADELFIAELPVMGRVPAMSPEHACGLMQGWRHYRDTAIDHFDGNR